MRESMIESEDIDFKDLIRILWDKRFFILIITAISTIVAVLYALSLPRSYEARSVLEIGYYNDGAKKTFLDSQSRLAEELSIVFIKAQKMNGGAKDAEVISITPLKSSLEFIEIVTNGASSTQAIGALKEVIGYVQDKHKAFLDDYIAGVKKDIDELNATLISAESKKNEIKERKIDANKKIDQELNSEKLDGFVSVLNELSKAGDKKISFNLDPKMFYVEDVEDVEDKLLSLEKSIEEGSYRNTVLLADIIIAPDTPIKPNRKIIVSVGFVLGFIFSIFLVFIIKFIKEFNSEGEDFSKKSHL